jgi:copper chaperone CopZ
MRRFLLLIAAIPLHGELLRVEQRYGGMECLSCVRAVESGIKRLRGVESVEAHPKSGVVNVALIAGNRVKLADIRDAVKATGFTPGAASIRAQGQLEEKRFVTGQETFELAGKPHELPAGEAMVEGDVPASGAGEPLRLQIRSARVVKPVGSP